MAGKFKIVKSTNGSFYFNLKADNGRNILVSETYASRTGAQSGINSVKINAPLNKRYERKHDSKGRPYFVLKAANDQVIGKSQMYSSSASMEIGIQSVKINGPRAKVEDLTRSRAA
jgi:uncharacterized protein YegP (UPF0339 family)